ncbi:MAG: RHS repeat domain-containing protein [Sandaracinaceae bacterium]
MRRLLLSVLILAGCAPPSDTAPPPTSSSSGSTEPARETPPAAPLGEVLTGWWETPPSASACTVHVTQRNGETTLTSVRHFEGGRQVSGTSHPRIDSDGQSRLTYADGRLVRIDYQLAEPEDNTPCDGCYAPPRRTRGAVEIRYDAEGRVEGYVNRRTTYVHDGEAWRASGAAEGTYEYTYDAEGRRTGFRIDPIGSELATGELRREGGRIASFQMQRGDFRVERQFQHDAEGQLVSRSRQTCRSECSELRTTAIEYDAEGRVAATRASDRTVLYTYDAGGHLTSQNEGRPFRYVYEDGRLTEIRRDPAGRASTHYRYEGACDGVDLSPRRPDLYEGTESEVCVVDPVYAVEHCIPVG